MRIGIIADDLTGAADTAVQFVRAGWNTVLQLRSRPSTASVIAVSTDSRALHERDAAESVVAAVKRHRDAGVTHLYKKIDSTLRGNVAAEVRALLESWSPRAIAIVCPAFPAAGRTVIDGELRVDGVRVSETAIAKDPITPVTESCIPKLLDALLVKANPAASARHLAEQIMNNGRRVVVDAATEHDLRLLAEAVTIVGPDAIAVGSAGLARELATVWATHLTPHPLPLAPSLPSPLSPLPSSLSPRPFPLAPVSAGVLVIVTSLHDVARRQVAALVAAGARHHQPAIEDLDEAAWVRWSEDVMREERDLKSVLLLTSPVHRGASDLAGLIPKRFGELAARILACGSVSGVAVTGGDAARALVDALDANGIDLRGEVITGVPIGMLAGGPFAGTRFVTKAGGFGDADTLIQAVEALRNAKI